MGRESKFTPCNLITRGEALNALEGLRTEARNEKKLDELIGYLREHRAFIPSYKARKELKLPNSSNKAEKANELLVARRQKHESMHWCREGADALCALQTAKFNGRWAELWQFMQTATPMAFAC